jgi:hypothetical protein
MEEISTPYILKTNDRAIYLGHNYKARTTGARSEKVTKKAQLQGSTSTKVLETVLVSRVIPSSQERLHRKGGGIKASKPKKEEQELEHIKPKQER